MVDHSKNRYENTNQLISDRGCNSDVIVGAGLLSSGRGICVKLGPRMLLVDDEPTICRAISRCFPQFRTTIAESGRHALERVKAADFDVVVCDVSLPDICGADLHDYMLAIRPSLLGRIVMMTGGPRNDEARHFLTRRDVVVLRKPFGPEHIRRAVADRLRQPLAS